MRPQKPPGRGRGTAGHPGAGRRAAAGRRSLDGTAGRRVRKHPVRGSSRRLAGPGHPVRLRRRVPRPLRGGPRQPLRLRTGRPAGYPGGHGRRPRRPGPHPHQRIFRTSGVRSVQSTPLVDHTGRLLGMISTHMSQPGRPSDQDLRIMELYGQLAGKSSHGT
ncbi:GAF domain-containing protein [Streptomyces sp. JCM17656]|nr:GAF domain-containing protein [Streptomyces sp. JCM17656]